MNKFISNLYLYDILYKNPWLISKIIKSYTKLFIKKGTMPLRKVDFAITFKCNANCSHCWSAPLYRPECRPLSLDEIKNYMKQAVDLGCCSFELTGGEPLLNKEISEIIKFAKSLKTIVGVSTNGILLDEEMTKALKNAEVDWMHISLDSPTEEEHDMSRGIKGCFNKVMRAVKTLQKYKIKVLFSSFTTPKMLNNGEAEQLIKFTQNKKILMSFNPACKIGRWSKNDNIIFSGSDKNKFLKLSKQPYIRWQGRSNFFGSGCPCGKETIFITAYGDVLPCGSVQVSYGNLRKEPLKLIWKRFHNIDFLPRNIHGCPVALDNVFIKKYIEPINMYEKPPISIDEHPALENID